MDILIVGGDADAAEALRRFVEGAGWDCPAANIVGPDRAEAVISRQKPRMVLLLVGADLPGIAPTVTRLRELMTGPLIAVGPVGDPRGVLSILRAGAADFIDEAGLDVELPAALERLDPSRLKPGVAGRFFAVIAPSGGSGASLVAVNLAATMAASHGASLLIDLKRRSGDLAAMLDLKPTHSLADLCQDVDRIDRVLLEQTLVKHGSGIRLLASPRSYAPLPQDSAAGLDRVLELGLAQFPRVVADVSPELNDASLGAISRADVILIVIRLEFNSLRNAKSMIEYLSQRGIDPRRVALVANRKGQPREIQPTVIEQALGRTFLATLPDEPKVALASQNNGVPLLIEAPRSKLAKALVALGKAADALPAPVERRVSNQAG